MGFYSPKEIVEVVNQIAINKNNAKKSRTLVLAILAGGYIAMGSLLAVSVGGGMPGIAAENPGLQKLIFGSVFPLGLMLVAIAGAELFTGNTAYFTPNIMSGKMTLKAPLRNWTVVYFGNFIGSIIVAYFFAYLTDIFAEGPWNDSIMSIAIKKTSAPFYKVFLKGIAANWMVCLAMWLAYASKDASGKIVGLWFPVMVFVAMGFEHSIANMFFIPTAMFYGADITWTQFIVDNLIPATLGNIVGGAIFVGMSYWYIYEKK